MSLFKIVVNSVFILTFLFWVELKFPLKENKPIRLHQQATVPRILCQLPSGQIFVLSFVCVKILFVGVMQTCK